MTDFMTVKQIAEAFGVSEKVVRLRIQVKFPRKIQNGVTTLLDIDEVKVIARSIFRDGSVTLDAVLSTLPSGKGTLPSGKGNSVQSFPIEETGDKLNYHLTQAVLELQRRDQQREQQIQAIVKVYGSEIKKMKQLPQPNTENQVLKERLLIAEKSLTMIQNKLSGKGTKFDPDTYFWNR